MHRGAALFESRKRVSEADHAGAFKRAQHYAACVLGCNQCSRRHDIEVAESPGCFLDFFDRAVLGFASDVAYEKILTFYGPFEHNAPSFSECQTASSLRSRSHGLASRVAKRHTKRRTGV